MSNVDNEHKESKRYLSKYFQQINKDEFVIKHKKRHLRKRKGKTDKIFAKEQVSPSLPEKEPVLGSDSNGTTKVGNNEDRTSSKQDFVIDTEQKLKFADYDKSSLELAQFLLGKILCRIDNGKLLCGEIVETEAYTGINDKACHAFGGKRTKRTEPMYMPAGTSYVYYIYGMYYCLNISSADEGGCALIRSLEPRQGLECMEKYRSVRRTKNSATVKSKDLCSGPSKLCQALNITKDNLNSVDMVTADDFFVVNNVAYSEDDIVACERIGIEGYGEKSASLPYRFYVKNNKNVSVLKKNNRKRKLLDKIQSLSCSKTKKK